VGRRPSVPQRERRASTGKATAMVPVEQSAVVGILGGPRSAPIPLPDWGPGKFRPIPGSVRIHRIDAQAVQALAVPVEQ
jgi:hypothetical protein